MSNYAVEGILNHLNELGMNSKLTDQTFNFYQNPDDLLYDFFWELYFQQKPSEKPHHYQ